VDKQAVEEIKQHFGVVAEGLESKIEIIAEGHALLRSEMKSSIGDLRSEVGELRSEVDQFRSEVGTFRSEVSTFRSEVRQDFGDVRSMIKLSYTEIDTRIGTLERELAVLKARVEQVEAAIR
jgi:predicted RNase H-like nuclease (RuvC/YqgF family)